MTGHIKWENLRRLPDPHAREVQTAYVDGYKMGVEDSLKELKEFQIKLSDQEDSDPELLRVMAVFFRGARRVVARRLTTANEALKYLKGTE